MVMIGEDSVYLLRLRLIFFGEQLSHHPQELLSLSLGRFQSLDVWSNSSVRDRLQWYYIVSVNEMLVRDSVSDHGNLFKLKTVNIAQR